jgi:hypothetical protein
MASDSYRFEVALSYAREDAAYVSRVARVLEQAAIPFFYDQNPEAALELWGRELPQQLETIYARESRHVVLFASAAYERKIWTRYEMKWALHTALRTDREYLLPARFDSTVLPGLPPDIVYTNLRGLEPERFGGIILGKVGATSNSVLPVTTTAPPPAPSSPEDWF